jgi:uncharacterized protein YndB with AHSA1/START domain
MANVTESTSVERELAIAARPETVWEFFVDPEKAPRWMGMRMELDVQPGGAYWMEVIPGHMARGEFVEVDPPRRLVYTWGWDEGPVTPGSTTIEIELEAQGEGTLLRFAHRDLPDVEAAGSHAHGWDHYLGRLAVAAGGGDPGADPWIAGPMD